MENLGLDVKKICLLCVLFLLLLIREMGRVPFDFLESESELISGLNLEYGGIYFVVIFLVEYGKLIFLCLFMMMLLCGFDIFVFFLNFVLVCFVVVVRGVYPRLRYDKLMFLCWKDLFFVLGVFMNVVLVLIYV
jgi:NADH:ubiquinone oxidoreductase subunit H